MTHIPKCESCMKKFFVSDIGMDSMNTASPMLLPCGHTFCWKCLTSLSDSKKGILCLKCKSHTKNWGNGHMGGLLPNFSVLGFLSVQDKFSLKMNRLNLLVECIEKKKSLKRDPSKQKCSECVEAMATTNCVQCGVSVCNNCFEMIHKNSRVLRRHQGIPLHRGGQDLSSLDCLVHHSLMEYYCTDDDALICSDCMIEDHAKHNVISLKDKSYEMVPDMRDALEKASPVIAMLKQHICNIDVEIKEVETDAISTANAIVQHFIDIVGKVQVNFLSLLNQLEYLSCAHVRRLLTLRDVATSRLQSMEQHCTDADVVVNSSKETEMFLVDPIKTLFLLKKASEYPCIMEKITTRDEDDEIDGIQYKYGRFSLFINSDIVGCNKKWAEIENTNQLKYIVRKANENELYETQQPQCDNRIDDLDDSISSEAMNNSISYMKPPKLRLVRVPPANNQELVFVTFVVSPDDFHVQRNNDQNQLIKIDKSFKSFNHRVPHEDEALSCIRIGELCVARYSHNHTWYRARVTNICKHDGGCGDLLDDFTAGLHDDVEIHFIDYGNNSKTKVSCLRRLPRMFQRIPPLAIPCSLVGVCPLNKGVGWPRQTISSFTKMISNRPILMTTLSREAGRRYVDLHKPAPDEIDQDVPVSVRDAMLFLDMARFNDKLSPNMVLPEQEIVKPRQYFKPSMIAARSFNDVVLSHYHSIDSFYVQLLDSNASYLEDVSKKIQKFVYLEHKFSIDPSSPFLILKPQESMPCLAKYECCNMWYRAKILEVLQPELKIRVIYVDYGNEAIIDLKDALKIPDDFMKLPYQGIKCKLDNIKPLNNMKEWDNESLTRFLELVGEDKQLKMYIRLFQDGIYSVELFDWTDMQHSADNMLSINERMVHEGLATGLTVHNVVPIAEVIEPDMKTQAENHVNKVSVEELTELKFDDVANDKSCLSNMLSHEGDVSMVTVIQSDSPASFHVQTQHQWLDCNKLVRNLHKQLSSEEDQQNADAIWNVDDKCAVKSMIEKRWCRGTIVEINHDENINEIVVHLVDFGFCEEVSCSSLRVLPCEFINEDSFITHCFLSNVQPAGGAKWTATSREVFWEMVAHKECKLIVPGTTPLTSGALPVTLMMESNDEYVDVGRELILRGVALPVLNVGGCGNNLLDRDPSKPLSKIQLQFEMSEVAYQRAENLCVKKSCNNWTPHASTSRNEGFMFELDDESDDGCDVMCDYNDNYEHISKHVQDADNMEEPADEIKKDIDQSYRDVDQSYRDVDQSIDGEIRRKIPRSEVPHAGTSFYCLTSHIADYDLFCLQKWPEKEIFPDGTAFILDLPLLRDFTHGTPCLACYDEDDEWYRGEVIRYKSPTVYVRYVDYGLIQAISDMEKLLKLPSKYMTIPAQAIMCRLSDIPKPDQLGFDKDDVTFMLARLLGRNKLLCSVVLVDGDVPVVKLYSEEADGKLTLISDVIARILTDPESCDLQECDVD